MKAIWLSLLLGAFLAGCAMDGQTHAGERYVVGASRTSFYKYGPAQGTGPDFALLKGQVVTMDAKQFGYSQVTTAEGQTGYVSSDDISPLPPEPKPSPAADKKDSRRKERRPTREEEARVPLPDLPESKPAAGAPGFRF